MFATAGSGLGDAIDFLGELDGPPLLSPTPTCEAIPAQVQPLI